MESACPCTQDVATPPRAAALTTRQRNLLRTLLERRDFSVEQVAALDFHTLSRTPGIGRKSIEIIRAWLLAQGRDLHNSPTARLDPVRQRRIDQRIERAVRLLRRHGYGVTPPPR